MQLLVTGGCGFIGSNLVRALLEDNWEVEILGRTRDVIKESLERAYNSADEDFSTMLNNAFAPGRKLGRRNNRSSRRSSDANMNRRGLSVSAIAALKNKLKPDAAREHLQNINQSVYIIDQVIRRRSCNERNVLCARKVKNKTVF